MTTTPADISETAQSSLIIDFPIWVTLLLGTPLDRPDFHSVLLGNRNKMDSLAYTMLEHPDMVVSTEPTEIDLVKVTLRDLGLKEDATLVEVYSQAEKLGLEPCPNEGGPRLCHQWPGSPRNQRVFVGMKPMLLGNPPLATSVIFAVIHYYDGTTEKGNVCLEHGPGEQDGFTFHLNQYFVFVKPRK